LCHGLCHSAKPSCKDLHVRLKSNGDYWQACWTDSTGKLKVKGLGSKTKFSRRQAAVLCRQLQADIVLQPGLRNQTKAPRLRDFLDRYLEHRTDLSPRTKLLHRKTAEYLAGRKLEDGTTKAGFFDPSIRISEISRAGAADWRVWLTQQRMEESTVCQHVRNAKTIFNRALDDDLPVLDQSSLAVIGAVTLDPHILQL
jgi:hypothetical protein